MVEAGIFGGEVLYGTPQNGTLSAGKISDLVPAEVQEKYKRLYPADDRRHFHAVIFAE